MAKVTQENRERYFQKVKPHQAVIHSILNRERDSLKAIQKDSGGRGRVYLDLAEEMIFLTTNYIVLSSVSESMLKVRNGSALNEARKSIVKAIIYLEKVVSPLVDAAFSEYEEQLALIAGVDAKRRYHIVKKLGLAIQILINAFGIDSKWKWAFVDLEGRYAAVAKNIIDLRTAVVNTDPRSADYEPTVKHLRLIKKVLQHAADTYRRKFESSTKHPDDINMAIQFLDSLKRIHIVMGERREVEALKRKTELWKMRLERSSENVGEEVLNTVEYG